MTPDYNICDMCGTAKCAASNRLRVIVGTTFDGAANVADIAYVDLCEVCLHCALNDLYLRRNPTQGAALLSYIKLHKKC